MRARGWSSWLIGVLLLVGCAHAPAPVVQAPPPPPPPPKPRTKLALLPAEAEPFPALATALNRALHEVKVAGIDDYFSSKVALEVVQLSIECVQPSSACYTAAGKSLAANKLLLAHAAAIGKRKRDKSVRVTITLFDVDAGEAANVVDRVYRTPELATAGADELVAEVAAEPPKPYGPELAPPARGQR